MVSEKRGFFRTLFGIPDTEIRSVVPNMTTTPPTWEQVSTSSIGVREALGIPEVAAAARIITTAVSQLDMTVERNGSRIDSALVRQPDMYRSASAFFKRTATNLVTTGNAYWRLNRNLDGAVVNMTALAPSRVLVRYDDNGNKFYEYSSATGKTQTLSNNLPNTNTGEVEHIKLFEIEDETLGLGPIQLNNDALAKIRSQRDYYENFLADSKRPSGLFAFDGHLDAEDLANIYATIDSKVNTGKPLVLPKGANYQSLLFNAEQAGLIDMKNAATLDVARIFGIPAYKLVAAVEGNSMTYANIGQADLAWVRESLEQYLTAIEDAMTNVLPRGQVAQFDVENWVRAAEAIAITQKETAPADMTN